MALSNILVPKLSGRQPSAPSLVARFSLDLDNSYPAAGGGYAFDPAALLQGNTAPKNFDKAPDLVGVLFPDTAGHSFVYDHATKKFKVYVKTTGVEVANTVDLSAVVGVVALAFLQ